MKRTLPLVAAGLILVGCSQSRPLAISHPRPAEDTALFALLSDTQTDAAKNRRLGVSPPVRLVQLGQASPNAAARVAASALIESMSDAQRAATVLPLDHDARRNWHFVPRLRPGLTLGDMTDDQRRLLNELLQSGLSNAGYLQAMDIVWLEGVLEELENRNDNHRDPGRYTLLLFGDPTDDSDAGGAWGWRFEGHHLSLNFTYTPDSVVSTPMFMGTAPAVVPHGLHAGRRILSDEHHLAFAFIATLTDEQREQMMIGDVPSDVVTGPGREKSLREPAGIAIELGDPRDEQFRQLIPLLGAYLHRYRADHINDPLRDWFLEPEVYFAWAGSTNPDEPHYYRIHVPDHFVIEYCTRDGGVDHIHGVFHDLTDPLAEDLLRRHFEEHHDGE